MVIKVYRFLETDKLEKLSLKPVLTGNEKLPRNRKRICVFKKDLCMDTVPTKKLVVYDLFNRTLIKLKEMYLTNSIVATSTDRYILL